MRIGPTLFDPGDAGAGGERLGAKCTYTTARGRARAGSNGGGTICSDRCAASQVGGRGLIKVDAERSLARWSRSSGSAGPSQLSS